MTDFSAVLAHLLAGEHLTSDDAASALGTILDGGATPAQTAGLLVALRAKGETAEEITGLVSALLDHAATVPVDPTGLVDTCGTGGDRLGTINVSTMAAVVAAGAGVKVAKHGNRAASSACGSADVLEALEVAIELSPEGVARCIDEVGIGFCFAPAFHPAMRHVGPIRRELGVPTVFNFLGPLLNPARVRRQVVGVSDPRMAERMLEVLVARGAEHAMVVHGADGLDELSTTGPATVWTYRDGVRSQGEVDPADLGLGRATVADLAGGDAATNAAAALAVFAGEPGPHREIVLLNAAAALVVGDRVDDLAAGVELAAAAIDSGAASSTLEGLARVSNEAAS